MAWVACAVGFLAAAAYGDGPESRRLPAERRLAERPRFPDPCSWPQAIEQLSARLGRPMMVQSAVLTRQVRFDTRQASFEDALRYCERALGGNWHWTENGGLLITEEVRRGVAGAELPSGPLYGPEPLLAGSITEAQLRRMQAGRRLDFAELSPTQQELVRAMILSRYLRNPERHPGSLLAGSDVYLTTPLITNGPPEVTLYLPSLSDDGTVNSSPAAFIYLTPGAYPPPSASKFPTVPLRRPPQQRVGLAQTGRLHAVVRQAALSGRLGEVLRRLKDDHGVEIAAQADLAGLPVIAAPCGLPLGRLMEHFALLFQGEWVRRDSGYVLLRDSAVARAVRNRRNVGDGAVVVARLADSLNGGQASQLERGIALEFRNLSPPQMSLLTPVLRDYFLRHPDRVRESLCAGRGAQIALPQAGLRELIVRAQGYGPTGEPAGLEVARGPYRSPHR